MSTYSGGGGGASLSDSAPIGTGLAAAAGVGAAAARDDHVHSSPMAGPISFGSLIRWVLPGWATSFSVNNGAVLGRLYYIPIYVSVEATYIRIAVDVKTASASALGRLGIYDPSADGRTSGALRLDAGQVDLSTTGVKEITISHLLPIGFYFLAFVVDTANLVLASPDGGQAITTPMQGGKSIFREMNGMINFTASRQADVAGGLSDPAPAVANNFTTWSNAFVLLREF